MKERKEVEVSKETFELADLVGDIVLAAYEASEKDKADTFEIMKKVFPVFSQKAGPALDGVELIDDELKEDPFAFAMAFQIVGKRVYSVVSKKKAEAEAKAKAEAEAGSEPKEE